MRKNLDNEKFTMKSVPLDHNGLYMCAKQGLT